MARAASPVAEQFQRPAQQREADFLGMWLFLSTEVMLFGGLFMAMVVYRIIHPDAVKEAAGHLYMWLGGLNTAVLLTSSLTMAIAVTAARSGARSVAVRCLAATAALGLIFLLIKATEYGLDYREGLVPGLGAPSPLRQPAAHLFINLYFVSTALHAAHMLIGISLVSGLTIRVARRGVPLPARHIVVEIVGLYWHFVDVVWVFLYPMLYLIGR